jgi:DMATS type aromatic prenyltransferase
MPGWIRVHRIYIIARTYFISFTPHSVFVMGEMFEFDAKSNTDINSTDHSNTKNILAPIYTPLTMGNGSTVITASDTSPTLLTATTLFTNAALTTRLQDSITASQPPYLVLESHLAFNPAMRFWWQVTAVPLSKLMTRMNYPLHLHYRYLAYYYDIVLPSYGPIPSAKNEQWNATLTPDNSAFEPSWNLQTTGTQESIVRFTIEAHSAESGHGADPLNQKSIGELVRRAAEMSEGVDVDVYKYVTSALFVSDEEGRRLRKAWPDHLPPQAYLAFDFEKTGRMLVKGSFFFMWKAKQTGRAPRDIVHELVVKMPVIGATLVEPLKVWYQWLRAFPDVYGGELMVEGLGFDLLTPGPRSRIKIYQRLRKSCFGAVTYFYTFGNRLQDPATTKGLELLKLFWVVVCGVQDDEDFMGREIVEAHRYWADIVVNWEFKAGEALPRPKLYFPLGKWLENDEVCSERLSDFWKRIGWSEMAGSYRKDWNEILYVYPVVLHSRSPMLFTKFVF